MNRRRPIRINIIYDDPYNLLFIVCVFFLGYWKNNHLMNVWKLKGISRKKMSDSKGWNDRLKVEESVFV